MITRDEFLEQARVYDLNHADVQREYVFGWLISGIFHIAHPQRTHATIARSARAANRSSCAASRARRALTRLTTWRTTSGVTP